MGRRGVIFLPGVFGTKAPYYLNPALASHPRGSHPNVLKGPPTGPQRGYKAPLETCTQHSADLWDPTFIIRPLGAGTCKQMNRWFASLNNHWEQRSLIILCSVRCHNKEVTSSPVVLCCTIAGQQFKQNFWRQRWYHAALNSEMNRCIAVFRSMSVKKPTYLIRDNFLKRWGSFIHNCIPCYQRYVLFSMNV